MPEFLIERVMPGVGALDVGDLKELSRVSFRMLQERFPTRLARRLQDDGLMIQETGCRRKVQRRGLCRGS